MKFEQEYVLLFRISYTMSYVRYKFRCNIPISAKIIKEMPGSVGSGTPCTNLTLYICHPSNSNKLTNQMQHSFQFIT